MESASDKAELLVRVFRRDEKRLLGLGGDRLELLTVVMQRVREQPLHTLFLTFRVAFFGLLGGLALITAVVVL